MTIATPIAPASAPRPVAPPAAPLFEPLVPLRLTVEQFHKMEEAGVFADDPYDNKIELLDGFAVYAICGDSLEEPTKMKPGHVQPIEALTDLRPQFIPHGCILRVQLPVTLPEFDEPLPDAAIVRGATADYASRHPGPDNILCLIEVSDASTWRDRGPKLRAYATAGVPDYIILHLPSRTAEVYTDPQRDQGRYGRSETLTAADTLRLPTATDKTVEVTVGDLLPA